MPSNKSLNKPPIRLRNVCGRADLAAVLADGDAVMAEAIADLAGFERQARAQPSETQQKKPPPRRPPKPPKERLIVRPLTPIPFWLPIEYEFVAADDEQPQPVAGTPYRGWTKRPRVAPTIPPLAEWRELEPKLRFLLCLPQPGQAIDVELTVRRLGEGALLTELPRKCHRRWGPALQLIEDRSMRLIPYRLDQFWVREALRRRLPAHALECCVFRDGLSVPYRVGSEVRHYVPPAPGGIVLLLGDLGCLSSTGSALCEYWLRFGRDLRAVGCIPVALIPGPLERCPNRLAGVWQLIPWERPRPPDPQDTLALRAERLLRLVSPAFRIEPGLLRTARLLLPPDRADAGTEADVWQHSDLVGRSAAGGTLNRERAKQLRAEFATQFPSELQARLGALLRAWRGYLPEEIWFEELLNLPPAARTEAEVAEDVSYACDYFAEFACLSDEDKVALSGSDLEWYGRVEGRAGLIWDDERVGDDLKRLSFALHEHESNYRPPAGFDPALIRRPNQPVKRIRINQQGEMLHFATVEFHTDDSPVVELSSRNGLIQIEVPSTWADDWGTDDYGHWVTFSIPDKKGEKITQKMRWIEPGTFQMGSPEDEPERVSSEGPQHPVTIGQGFWLFDTACTQALWEAVMGENPSRFKGAARPVENVSWNDCQDFLKRLNERVPGLDLALPSEAQWEYACRAGTVTPFSFGANITPEQVNYDGNFPYAGGKTGQYRQETVPVASLPPNPWGLYEMHGNIWEWCQDHRQDNYQGALIDGSVWEGSDAGDRVLRGGSWYVGARYVRAASRYADPPDDRDAGIGFRCARVRVVSPAGQEGAEPAGPARGRQAERRPEQGPLGGATGAEPTLLRLDAVPLQDRCPLPQAPAFLIRTDREHLTFRRIIKPTWASAIGRDRFGLWCEITVEPKRGEPVIQRLRWIPPGRFWMGSLEEETRGLAKEEHEREWFEREHPRNLVTLTDGYWLFDTPCTQALWEAVMEENPSRFQSPIRPVETVSWHDVQDFLKQLNAQIPDLDLVLPSEAQWEYACRAGTETAIYTGNLAILGQCNAPALDPIAWYSGNSGVEFELTDGEDSSSWPEKRYPHTKAGTHPVKLKQANPWGLYDMLGNVWEWCQDGMRDYDQNVRTNPMGSLDAGANRVLRGGTWHNDARDVRAAYRFRDLPDYRYDDLGFRCARVRGEPSQPAG
ncbi:MAG TPA: formylglycine-generating enzyme family protein [Candidatus Competibacter phosphatis]|nr:formylglycine-generating enzyme family protein [Candidatus Competibacter phosphatis]